MERPWHHFSQAGPTTCSRWFWKVPMVGMLMQVTWQLDLRWEYSIFLLQRVRHTSLAKHCCISLLIFISVVEFISIFELSILINPSHNAEVTLMDIQNALSTTADSAQQFLTRVGATTSDVSSKVLEAGLTLIATQGKEGEEVDGEVNDEEVLVGALSIDTVVNLVYGAEVASGECSLLLRVPMI